MFNPIDFVAYMKDLVDAYPPKNISFAVDDFDDLLDGRFHVALNASSYNFRLIEPMFDDFRGENGGLILTATTGFYLSKKIASLTAQAVKEAQDDVFKLVRKILARLVYDSRNDNPFFAHVFNRFEDANLKIDKQTFQNGAEFQIGYLVTFQLRFEFLDDVDTLVSDTNWLDL